MRLEELVLVVLEVFHAWGVIVVVELHITQACGAIVGVVFHHVIQSCGGVGIVAHRGFFIDIILGSRVPRHDSQDQVVYMEVVGVRDTTSNLTLPWKIVSCKWQHLRAIKTKQSEVHAEHQNQLTTKTHTHTHKAYGGWVWKVACQGPIRTQDVVMASKEPR